MRSHAEILTDAEEWLANNPDAPLGQRVGMAMFVESRAEAGADISIERLARRLGLTEKEALEALDTFSKPIPMLPWDGKIH